MATDTSTSPAPSRPRRVIYPERDGKPMGETRSHQQAMIGLIIGLEDLVAADPRTVVGGNQFVYFVKGHPGRVVAPDVFVARGVDPGRSQRACKTWENDGIGPELVVEVSSPSTRREDLRGKFLPYRDVLRVRESFVFDPLGEYLRPRSQEFRLKGGDCYAIDPVAGRLPSAVLDVHLAALERLVRLFDPGVGRVISTRAEALAAPRRAGRRQSRTIRDQDAVIAAPEEAIRARDRAPERDEAGGVALRAEIARLRGGEGAG